LILYTLKSDKIINSLSIRSLRGKQQEGSDDEDDDDEDGEEGENEEEEEEEEEEEAGGTGQPELTREERRELKKKQAAQKQAPVEEVDEDLINPNHVAKKLNISDLGESRELSRRERYDSIHLIFLDIPWFNFRLLLREQKEKADAKERYWKVSNRPSSVSHLGSA
jgi:hypothetical protein